jgi:hypothetical protein
MHTNSEYDMKLGNNRRSKGILAPVFAMASARMLIIAAGLGLVFFTSTSFAMYSDTQTSANSSFQTGTLSLGVNPATALFNVSNMKPGDASYAPLTLTNAGSLSLSYSMTSSASNADSKGLAAALTAEVKLVPGATCNATTFGASSTVIAPSVTGLASLATTAGRTVAAAGTEVACFKVTLPSTAGNALQGASTTASFTFAAAQV